MRFTERIHLEPPRAGRSVAVPRTWITAITVVWVIVGLYVAQSFVPRNVISLPGQSTVRKAATVITPQGWAFFTKSAKDPQYAPYRMTDGTWRSAALTPHSKPSNFFGFDRASRSQGIEVALLLHQDNVRWTPCGDTSTVDSCLRNAATEAVSTTNPSPSPTLCGRASVIEMKPVRWAWRHFSSERHTPERAAVWEISCP
ncbi:MULTISPECIES: SdpA family antimicrobial peptide system protein [Streptomyces]|uniref:SdpA family antimicrobial peptide system protein n=1 Tax=Streptomyces TaxID=1883 RepID=UPI000B118D8E|nr:MULTISPECIES: SdpA family antimicrobial peptide system protein [Streptomyces]MDH6229326.1 antimicrobial peptide system SdpA family protein [Streptomyces sp. MJP52]